jgi:hypothetical protein
VEAPDLNADRKDSRPGSGVSLQTLIIASVASAVASFAVSRIWGAGTLISAAVTPVIVALVAEFLRRPVQTVAATAKKVPTVQTLPGRKRTFAAPGDPTRVLDDPTRVTTDVATGDESQSPSGQPLPRRRVEPPADSTSVVDPGTINPAEANTWRPHWRLVVVTGLLAFAIVVALYTVPDLLAGRSITGNGQPTTFFGGSANVKQKPSPTLTVTTTTPVTTVTKTVPATTTTQPTTTQPTTTQPTTTGATTTTNATTPTTTQTTTSTTAPAVNTTTTPTTPVP